MYLGGDEIVVEMPEGDRGDGLEPAAPPAPASESPSSESPAPETPPETPPELTDEQKRQLPPRGEDGKFIKASDPEPSNPEPSAQPQGDEEPRIPKARLDKEIEKRRLLEKQLAELQGTKQAEEKGAAQTYDFDAAEKEYMDLLLDGKLEDAAAKRKEIRAAERAEIEALADQRATHVNTRQSLQERMDVVSTQYEKDYPGFNPESDDYDATAIARAQAVYKGYIESGLYDDPVVAFQEALDTVVLKAGWQKPGAAAAPTPTPTPPPARTAAKRVEAIQAQPPIAAAAGQSGASAGAAVVPDPMTLTEDQLAKLPIATLKRLRGDEL